MNSCHKACCYRYLKRCLIDVDMVAMRQFERYEPPDLKYQDSRDTDRKACSILELFCPVCQLGYKWEKNRSLIVRILKEFTVTACLLLFVFFFSFCLLIPRLFNFEQSRRNGYFYGECDGFAVEMVQACA